MAERSSIPVDRAKHAGGLIRWAIDLVDLLHPINGAEGKALSEARRSLEIAGAKVDDFVRLREEQQ